MIWHKGSMLRKPKLRANKNNFIAIAVVFFVFLALMTGLHLYKAKNESAINAKKIGTLAKFGKCYTAIPQLEKMRPDTSQIQASIQLMSYEDYCYTAESKYDKAIAVESVLQSYYTKAGEVSRAAAIREETIFIKQQISHKVSKNDIHNESVTPAFYRKITNEVAEP